MIARGACAGPATPDEQVEGVAARGYAVVADALPVPVIEGLRRRAMALDASHGLTQAGIGREGRRMNDAAVRGDSIAWLPDQARDRSERVLFAMLEGLRTRCNRELQLGLFDIEGHYALYPPGAAYARHLDRFRDLDTRVLSFVLYLNDAWRPAEGGALRLYVDDANSIEVTPAGGTAVVFLSARFEHEVLPGTRPRWSVTGWFRRRPV